MTKKCFIIMPISDDDNYSLGHFGRVYEHIIKPACEIAGFEPIRADDIMTTNYIALDIIKNIIQCEMAVCDLSARNPNVLYELGIRQAFNLPVTLMKDSKTKRIFDIQGFRDIEYDESLRIDTVETIKEDLAELIKNTYENKSTEINSLISLLGIEPAKVSDKKKISTDTELILNSLTAFDKRFTQIERAINHPLYKIPGYGSGSGSGSSQASAILPLPETVGEILTRSEIDNLKVGDKVFHIRHGKGEVMSVSGTSLQRVTRIIFENATTRAFTSIALVNQLRKM